MGWMDLVASPVVARRLGRIRLVALAWIALLVGHDAVFAAQYGLGDAYRTAMASGGHAYWDIAVALGAIGGVVVLTAAFGVWRLERLASGRRLGRRPAIAAPSYRATLLALWPRLLAIVVIGFALQENVEHLTTHGHVIGVGALVGAEYPLALPILGLVSLLLAALGAVVRWRIRLLAWRVSHGMPVGRHRPRPAPRSAVWLAATADLPHRWTIGRPDAGRGPPHPLAA